MKPGDDVIVRAVLVEDFGDDVMVRVGSTVVQVAKRNIELPTSPDVERKVA